MTPMTKEARTRAAMVGLLVVTLSLGVMAVPRDSGRLQPPDWWVPIVAISVLLAMPGALAMVGAAAGRRAILIVAGVLCGVQSVIAFSGVTLVYLIPAVLLLWAAGGDDVDRPPVRPSRILLAALLGVPIVAVLIGTIGFLAPLVLILVAALVRLRRRTGSGRSPIRIAAGEALLGVGILVLVVAAWVTFFAMTETACWVAGQAADGGLSWQRVPAADTRELGPGEVAETCAGGQPTPLSLELAGGLLLAAAIGAGMPLGAGRDTAAP